MRWFTEKTGFFGFVLVLSLMAMALHHYLRFFGEINHYYVYGMVGVAIFSAFVLMFGAMASR